MIERKAAPLKYYRIHSKQSALDTLSHEYDFDGIGKLPGFRTILHATDCDPSMTCFQHVFADHPDLKSVVEEVLTRGDMVWPENVKRGHIVFYSQKEIVTFAKDITHVAIAVGDGEVQSRFGETHVYEHPYQSVLSRYGGYVLVLTRPEGVLLNTAFHGVE